ncbi:MAG: glycosyltransferase family 2 protein [Solirubrobacteraceae bacterium]
MTLLVHNEEEMLEANLEYHLAQGVDFVIVTDHGSTDATASILRGYEERGLVRVIRVEGHQHHQSRRVTRMARLAAIEYQADWVINNDADEFWWPGAGTLAQALCSVPERYGQVVAARHDFLPVAGHDGAPFHQRLIVREPTSHNLKGQALEPKVAHRGHPAVIVAPGNHSISNADLPATPPSALLEVLHFPMRTLGQFERKVLATGLGYESLPSRSREVGRDQLHLLAAHRRGELPGYFAAHLLSEDAIADGVAAGRLVIDDRLQRFMAALGGARHQ